MVFNGHVKLQSGPQVSQIHELRLHNPDPTNKPEVPGPWNDTEFPLLHSEHVRPWISSVLPAYSPPVSITENTVERLPIELWVRVYALGPSDLPGLGGGALRHVVVNSCNGAKAEDAGCDPRGPATVVAMASGLEKESWT